ncbi:hypothetical protein TNCV_2629571 [Trichonephila clavipes]|uniref:Uncharacterized protein n=1 Tax=Trichonephila clavipes TaxID=2585209 RepID=A0A8X6SNT0_TRICX|nr:hypothetical protein TNCV_2629571 [Trichonephila clavipes]
MQQAISSKRGILKGFRGATLALAQTRVTFTSDLNIDLTKTHAAYASLEASSKTCNSEVELIIMHLDKVKVSISVQHFKVSVSKFQITPRTEVSPELLPTFLPATLLSKRRRLKHPFNMINFACSMKRPCSSVLNTPDTQLST